VRDMKEFLRNNGLTLVLMALFLGSIAGHALAGWRVENEEQATHGRPSMGLGEYVRSGPFVETVFENWESEFLQMAAYVLLTAFLFQKGSAESKDPDEKEEVDEDPRASVKPDSPRPVRRGGLLLKVYSNSLSLALVGLFLFSFAMHAVGGARAHNEEELSHGRASNVSVIAYVGTSKFWFESFQNWQSEFLSVAAMVFLSVYLRQKGSPESKPVASPHTQTGC
jgi:hypothetical protein